VLLAHGLGGRTDLPLPTWMVSYGGAAVVIASFLALGALWRTVRWEGRTTGTPVLDTGAGWARAVFYATRALGLAAFVLVTATAIAGDDDPSDNLAPVAVYIVLWVAVPFICVLIGGLWRLLNPFDTIAAAIERLTRPVPGPAVGYWPAAAGLAGFVWLELVYPDRAEPRTLAIVIVGYTLLVGVGAARYGRDWAVRSEAFTALFEVLAHAAPLGRDTDGRIRVRPPFSGLASLEPLRGLDAVVLVILGSTTFDGLTRTRFWTDLSADYEGTALTLVGTAGLIWTIGIVAVIYTAAIRTTARSIGSRPSEISLAFAPSLVPIAFAYTVAHYFSLLILEGQAAISLLSDPFGRDWDLFGTADRAINYNLLSPTAISWVQALAIIAGHIAAVVVAHDRALARFPKRNRSSAQYPLLGAMVIYTIGGLVLLLGG
jgi:hypothetical protein